jgi:MFS family permease
VRDRSQPTVSIIVVSGAMMQLIPTIGQRLPLVTGTILITGALLWLSAISASGTYAVVILGPMLLYGIGMGMVFMPLTMIGVSEVEPEETGAASGLLNATQQMGGSLGLAIMVTVYGAATSGATGSKSTVLTTGASAGFLVAAGFTLIAFLIAASVVRPAPSAAVSLASRWATRRRLPWPGTRSRQSQSRRLAGLLDTRFATITPPAAA